MHHIYHKLQSDFKAVFLGLFLVFRLGLIKMCLENQILNSLELDVCKGQT